MKKYNDVEDLYREMFFDYKPEPPEKVWENIQAISRTKTKSSLWKKISFPVVGVVAVSAIVYLLVMDLQPEKNVATAVNDKKQVDRPKINAEQNTTNNVADLSVNTYSPVTQQTVSTNNNVPETKTQTVEHAQNTIHSEKHNLPETQPNIVANQPVPTDKKETNSTALSSPVKHAQEQQSAKPTQNKNTTGKKIIISKDTTICEQTSVHLYAYNVENIRWSTGETQSLITVHPSYDEQYSVTFTTDNMKDSTVHIHVKVAECPEVYVPNIFTPNGDGLNDVFLIKTKMELTFFEMSIYATNGKQLLFSSKNINHGWDGTHRGQIQPQGLYFYTVRYTDKFGRNTEKHGELLLILQ